MMVRLLLATWVAAAGSVGPAGAPPCFSDAPCVVVVGMVPSGESKTTRVAASCPPALTWTVARSSAASPRVLEVSESRRSALMTAVAMSSSSGGKLERSKGCSLPGSREEARQAASNSVSEATERAAAIRSVKSTVTAARISSATRASGWPSCAAKARPKELADG